MKVSCLVFVQSADFLNYIKVPRIKSTVIKMHEYELFFQNIFSGSQTYCINQILAVFFSDKYSIKIVLTDNQHF